MKNYILIFKDYKSTVLWDKEEIIIVEIFKSILSGLMALASLGLFLGCLMYIMLGHGTTHVVITTILVLFVAFIIGDERC